MKLCFSTLACPGWSLGQVFEAAEKYGMGIDFRGLGHEIDVTKLPAFRAEIDSTLSELHRRGLEMPCLNTSITLVTPASERWQMMLEECERYARLAEKTRTPYLRVFGGATPKTMTQAEGVMLGQRHLKQLIKICKQYGCKVLLETHDQWATSTEIGEVLNGLDVNDVGVLWDLEHPYRKGEMPEVTAAGIRERLCHVHIRDSIRSENKNCPTLLGEGDLPLDRMLGALASVNYRGWICLEAEKRWIKETPEPEETLPQFVEFMRGALVRHAN